MRIKEITDALERFAPLPLQDGFDNAGMQVGLTDAEVTGALLCLDVTEAVLDEAIALGYNLVVAHHPLLFKGCKSITGADYVERCLLKAIKNDIAIYAAHTNLDNVTEGVNFKIAQKIGLTELRFLDTKEGGGSGVIGLLKTSMTELDFLRHIKKTFEVGCVKHNRLMGREIRTVALCGGAGAFLMPQAIRLHADAFVTGEIRYHEYFGHEGDLLLAEIGHYESEQYTKEIFKEVLNAQFPSLKVQPCKVNTNPIKYL
ncbi:MAG: Nif3-like dinuclear metal center hexameric protein [Mediterranea sp.]|jgi:dinuclear metal center YbgI/SA1388 family protein|nr:Nif3-like dinuclear metal center hexameric protein [Mediterranea sp.]